MVSFTPTGFTIHIETNSNPTEEWLLLHQQIIELMRSVDPANGISNSDYYVVLILLQALMPNWDQAQKLKQ